MATRLVPTIGIVQRRVLKSGDRCYSGVAAMRHRLDDNLIAYPVKRDIDLRGTDAQPPYGEALEEMRQGGFVERNLCRRDVKPQSEARLDQRKRRGG
jgi:hypothetical protein